MQLSGSDARLATWIPGCDPDLDAARASLAWDALLVVGYVILLAAILRRWWPLYQAPKLKAAERAVIALPVAAGVLDLVENALIFAGLDVGNRIVFDRFTYPDRLALPVTIATIAWVKWLALGLALVAAVMALMLAVARRKESDRPVPAVVPARVAATAAAGQPEGLGVCCSGGGIRAAAFSLGALERLEVAGVMDRAKWLTAVSGGSYAATSWRLVKASDAARPAAADIVAWLEEQIPGSPAGRHRFLRNGPGGLGRSVISAVAYIALYLVVLAALVFALSWPLGWVIGSDAVQPVLRTLGALPDRIDIPAELWLPGVIVMLAGAAVLGVSALPSYRLATLWRPAAGLIALGVALELFLVGAPLAMVTVGAYMHGGTASARAAVLGTTALAGVAGTVLRMASKPVLSRFSARLPELGGLLLVAAGLIWAGKVATDAAVGTGLFRSPITWVAVTASFVGVYLFVGISGPTIHRIYRIRLRRTFGLARDGDGNLWSPPDDEQLTWADMPATDPELIVCCARQRTGIAPGGLPAETFTISRTEVRMGDHVAPTGALVAALPRDLAAERQVASWIATSGAAFASAMGRLSKGSTNALMAALNIDLGIWLPNPRLVEDPHARFPKVRFGYLFKEILGWYDPADRFVFVADGGHWENLGLVELLRRRAATILCIDASGDQVGAFTTLH
ncbi:MAG: hypothetical protein H0W46_12840, partial [Acidimicrobiia bacterium]|nr:hypothetical protein [Acidimicrobiia bacterium]